MRYEDNTLRLNCKRDSSCHQFAMFLNRWFFQRHPMSARGRNSDTVVGEIPLDCHQNLATMLHIKEITKNITNTIGIIFVKYTFLTRTLPRKTPDNILSKQKRE